MSEIDSFSYWVFIPTLLLAPVIALIAKRWFRHTVGLSTLITILGGFLVYGLVTMAGWSLIGDHIDYLLAAIGYILFCVTVARLWTLKEVGLKILSAIGWVSIAICWILGLFGILLFIVISQDYDAKNRYMLTQHNEKIEVRQYVYGFVTMMSTKYSFESYRRWDYLPIEQHISTDVFKDLDTDLNLNDGALNLHLQRDTKGLWLVLSNKDGRSVKTRISG